MSGNYDSSITPVNNVNTGIDNRTSFKTNNGRTQFINTVWNDTSYVKDDKNEGVEFKVNEGMTLKLNRRYNNGGDATFANMDRNHTGISFDLLDKFIEAAGKGILEDVDHQGYTDENKKNFGKAFDELRAKKLAEAKLDPYKNEYTKMKNGTEFTFSADEIETLYKAAGFDIPAVKESEPTKKHETSEPDAVANKPEAEKTPEKTEETKAETTQGLQVGSDGQISEDKIKDIVNTIAEQLGIENAEDLDIPFGGKQIIDHEGNITEEIRFTYNGKKYLIERGTKDNQVKITEDKEGVNIQEELGYPNTEINNNKYKQRYNKKTGELQQKRVGLFHRWHNVTNTAPESAEEMNVKGVNSIESVTAANEEAVVEKTPEQIRQEKIQEAIEKFENGEEVTVKQKGSFYKVPLDNGDEKYVWQRDGKMVKLADGTYAFKNTKNPKEAKYYTVEYQNLRAYGYQLTTGEEIKGAVEAQ